MPTVGERLRDVRKRRGLSQKQLSERSGVSESYISKLEQEAVDGKRLRLETARNLARALHVPTSALVPTPREEDASQSTVDLWAPVREALLAPPDAALDSNEPPPTVAGVNAALQDALPLFSSDQFSELGLLLPPMLRDADALVASGREGREVRVRLLQLTGWLLTQTRQFEDAATALTRSLDDASDGLERAATVNTICWLHLRTGNLTEARELATKWADEMEPRRVSRATSTELSTWGWLLLRVSNAAIRDNREGEADDALRLAGAAAAALGREYAPGNDALRTFGPLTVSLKRAENYIIRDQPDQTLRLAERIPARGGLRPTTNNWNRHLLDVANAHSRTGDHTKAVEIMTGVARTSPQWLPNQRYAKDIMENVVSGRRKLTPEMRELADIVGISL